MKNKNCFFMMHHFTFPLCIHIPRDSLLLATHNLSLNNFDTFYECSSNGNRSIDACCTCCVVKSMPLDNCPILFRPFWSNAGPALQHFCNMGKKRNFVKSLKFNLNLYSCGPFRIIFLFPFASRGHKPSCNPIIFYMLQ